MVEDPTRMEEEAAVRPESAEPIAYAGGAETERQAWFKVLAGIVVSPRSSFAIVREHRPWAGAAALLLALSAVQFLATWPSVSDEPLLADMADALPGLNAVILVGGTVFGLFSLIGAWLFQALVVWLLVTAFRGEGSFGQSFSLAVHLGVVAWLGGLVSALLSRGRGPEGIASPTELADAVIVPGLNLLFPTGNWALEAVLMRITPFTVWHVALLGLGAAAVFRLSERKGFLIAGTLWAATTAFLAALAGVASLIPTP